MMISCELPTPIARGAACHVRAWLPDRFAGPVGGHRFRRRGSEPDVRGPRRRTYAYAAPLIGVPGLHGPNGLIGTLYGLNRGLTLGT